MNQTTVHAYGVLLRAGAEGIVDELEEGEEKNDLIALSMIEAMKKTLDTLAAEIRLGDDITDTQ